MFGEWTDTDRLPQLSNMNRVRNETKDNTSKDFGTVKWDRNRARGLKPYKLYDHDDY